MSANPFDFRKPPPDILIRRVKAWMAESCRLAEREWAKLLPFQTELVAGAVAVAPAGQVLHGFGNDFVGLTLKQDAGDGVLAAIPRPLLLAILSGLMGDPPTALPADRDLTSLESTLCDYVTGELLLPVLKSAWPLPEPLPLSVGPSGAVQSLWRLPRTEPLLTAEMQLKTPFGEFGFTYLLAKADWLEKLALPVPARSQLQSSIARRQIEDLVGEMSVDVAVVLGTADLTLFDLARLRTGDLVMLNQKVDDPLEATVGGTKKFQVWPGARGSRQAVQVYSAESAPADPNAGAEGIA